MRREGVCEFIELFLFLIRKKQNADDVKFYFDDDTWRTTNMENELNDLY